MKLDKENEYYSLKYWQKNEQKLDQKFYTAFSLLGTAIINYLTAKDFNSKDTNNWQIAAYYYSMLFSIRLILFIATGNYPLQHRETPAAISTLIQANKKIQFDWLKKNFLAENPREKKNAK